jgi:LPS export ABC transporter protein LptC
LTTFQCVTLRLRRGRLRTRITLAVCVCLALLTACSDSERPPTSSVLPDSVDQAAYGFVKYITADGVVRARLEADSAYHYPSRESYELFSLRIEFRTEEGEIRSTLTSKSGSYNWRSGNMEARDSVRAVTPDGRVLTTCKILYDQGRDELTGPCAFVYEAPNERATGESFTSDPDFRNVEATEASGIATEIERR